MNARLDELRFASAVGQVSSPPGLDPRRAARALAALGAGPRAVHRATRRTRRTAGFLVHGASHLRREVTTMPGPAASRAGQGYAGFMAENICALNGFELRVSGPVPERPALLVCNHVSWQDGILINSVVPSLAIIKSEVASWPLIGELARGLGYLFIERGDAHSGARLLLDARRRLTQGCSILTFPEGTTTYGEGILSFHRGIFGLSRLTDVPIVPIALRYELGAAAAWVGDDSFFPHFIKTVARERTVSYLDFGAPMHAAAGDRAEDFAARVRDVMLTLLQARRP